jgi:vitamin B12/bleomycin/antimicrobial peptide transport system ATP-binding/permease protein
VEPRLLRRAPAAAFAYLLGRFCLLAGLFIVTAVYRQYLTQTLEMRWRRWLTDEFLRRWLDDRVYYRFEHIQRATDDPDQRIAEDLKLLASGSLALATGLLNAAVTLFSFVGILWTLSGPLAVPLGGRVLNIPACLVWAAIVYAFAGSVTTHRIGPAARRPQRETAAHRGGFPLRPGPAAGERGGGGALRRGPLEEQSLRERFAAILDNWWWLLWAQKRLTWFTAGYGQAASSPSWWPPRVTSPAPSSSAR